MMISTNSRDIYNSSLEDRFTVLPTYFSIQIQLRIINFDLKASLSFGGTFFWVEFKLLSGRFYFE